MGKWWRFDRYHIQDGALRPSTGASLVDYDPWAAYQQARSKGTEPPYRSLLALVDRLPSAPAAALSTAEEAALVAWCSQYGLLGLLPHRAMMLVLAPRWLATRGQVGVESAVPIFVRVGDQWQARPGTWKGTELDEDESRQNQLVDRNEMPPSILRPTAVISEVGSDVFSDQPLGDAIGRFFPDVPTDESSTYLYPRPLTPPFWQQYAEPIADFMEAAQMFRLAAVSVARLRKELRLTPKLRQEIGEGVRVLNTLSGPVRPVLTLDASRKLRSGWAAGSLLAAFATMLQQDADDGWRVVQCEACGEVFTTHDSRVRWCKEQCRWRISQRAHRSRKRAR